MCGFTGVSSIVLVYAFVSLDTKVRLFVVFENNIEPLRFCAVQYASKQTIGSKFLYCKYSSIWRPQKIGFQIKKVDISELISEGSIHAESSQSRMQYIETGQIRGRLFQKLKVKKSSEKRGVSFYAYTMSIVNFITTVVFAFQVSMLFIIVSLRKIWSLPSWRNHGHRRPT